MILAGMGTRGSRRERAIRLLSRVRGLGSNRSDMSLESLTAATQVGMAERLTHTPSQMSGGEQQRVTVGGNSLAAIRVSRIGPVFCRSLELWPTHRRCYC
jgi:ABC-type glutathione transport system ATPase component